MWDVGKPQLNQNFFYECTYFKVICIYYIQIFTFGATFAWLYVLWTWNIDLKNNSKAAQTYINTPFEVQSCAVGLIQAMDGV